MSAQNSCHFIGRIASDVNVSQAKSQKGDAYTKVSFSFAVNKTLSAQQKQANDQAQQNQQPKPFPDASFVLVTASGGKADVIAKYGVKGKPFGLTCEMYTFPDQANPQKTVVAFSVSDIAFLPKDSTQQQQGQQGGYQAPAQQGGYQQQQGGYQPPAQQGYQAPPQQQGGYQPQQGGYQQPVQQGYQAPSQYRVDDDDVPF